MRLRAYTTINVQNGEETTMVKGKNGYAPKSQETPKAAKIRVAGQTCKLVGIAALVWALSIVSQK